MDPHVVFDCQKALPNRFALTLAAAARSRALGRGAEPRLDADNGSVTDLALHEIAAGVFTRNELAPFLLDPGGKAFSSSSRSGFQASRRRLREAPLPASRQRETVH